MLGELKLMNIIPYLHIKLQFTIFRACKYLLHFLQSNCVNCVPLSLSLSKWTRHTCYQLSSWW